MANLVGDEVKNGEDAINETELFRFMADHAGDPFILMREDGSFAYLNNKALEKWGYTREEAQFLKVPDVDAIYNSEKYRELFHLCRQSSIPPFKTFHKNKTGHIYPVEVTLSGLRAGGESF